MNDDDWKERVERREGKGEKEDWEGKEENRRRKRKKRKGTEEGKEQEKGRNRRSEGRGGGRRVGRIEQKERKSIV